MHNGQSTIISWPRGKEGPVGIITPLKHELRPLYLQFCRYGEGLTFEQPWVMNHFGKGKVVTIVSGIGWDKSAAATQHLIHSCGVRAVVLAGTAGALHEGLKVGDVVISKRVTHHNGTTREHGRPLWLTPDERLLRVAAEAAGVGGLSHHMRSGTIVTTDGFVSSREMRQFLHMQYGADCVEMEGAAVGRVCEANAVPWLIIRGITDLADENSLVRLTGVLPSVMTTVSCLTTKIIDYASCL